MAAVGVLGGMLLDKEKAREGERQERDDVLPVEPSNLPSQRFVFAASSYLRSSQMTKTFSSPF